MNEREISLTGSTMVIAVLMTISQCSIDRNLGRLADTADATMCIEGAKAGIDKAKLPKACKEFAK